MNFMASLSNKPQPEPAPIPQLGQSPSLWIYLVLLAGSGGLIGVAFSMQTTHDWPGLLLNLASGLIGSVVILVVIDRRLRAQELATLRSLPMRTTHRFLWLLFPTERVAGRYARSLLIALQPLVMEIVALERFAALEQKVHHGFLLLAGPGEGKTAWTQFVAASLSRQYLDNQPTGRIAILFPLRRWLPDRSLKEALYETFSAYAPCKRYIFHRLLGSGKVVVLLDGYDELWVRPLPLQSEIKGLRKQFPKVAWTLTSRTDKPTPADFGEPVALSAPTTAEMEAIKRNRHA